jgi:hypothetical protein
MAKQVKIIVVCKIICSIFDFRFSIFDYELVKHSLYNICEML